MDAIWRVAITITGIGGVAAFVLFMLYREWLRLPIFSTMTKDQQFRLFRQFLYLTFVFAVLGLLSYVATSLYSANSSAVTSNTYKASVSIKKFDLVDKFTTAPKIVESDSFNISNWGEAKTKLVSSLLDQLRNTKYPDIVFTIAGNDLRTSQNVVLWMPGVGIQGLGSLRPITELTPDSPLDLSKLFAGEYPGAYFFSDNAVELRFRCTDKFFETDQLSMKQSDGQYFFVSREGVSSTVTITPRLKVIMLDKFDGQGDLTADGLSADFKVALETALIAENSLTLSSFSMAELDQVRSELIKWPFQKDGKGGMIAKYAVDVIISSTVIATPE